MKPALRTPLLEIHLWVGVAVRLTLTGVVPWWPAARRALKAGLTLNPKLSGRRGNLNLHKTIGFYVSLVLCGALSVPVLVCASGASYLRRKAGRKTAESASARVPSLPARLPAGFVLAANPLT